MACWGLIQYNTFKPNLLDELKDISSPEFLFSLFLFFFKPKLSLNRSKTADPYSFGSTMLYSNRFLYTYSGYTFLSSSILFFHIYKKAITQQNQSTLWIKLNCVFHTSLENHKTLHQQNRILYTCFFAGTYFSHLSAYNVHNFIFANLKLSFNYWYWRLHKV